MISVFSRVAWPRVSVVGVSGPDGAGKSGLVRRLRESLAEDGVAVETTYLYGCVICRRMPEKAGEVALRLSVSTRSGAVSRSLARAVRGAHGLVDAAELGLRLGTSVAVAAARGRARSGRAVLLTDRSPLDGLAKHGPAPGSLTSRAYRRLAARYDAILLLSAPPDVLALRDGDHDAATLARATARFDCAAASIPVVVRIDTGATSRDAVAEVAAAILDRQQEGSAHPGPAIR